MEKCNSKKRAHSFPDFSQKKNRSEKKAKVINDPIHGHLPLSPLALAIIDTPEFQRLRHLKQLGCAYFVYPGAEHTRFQHSIGVYHLARTQMEILKRKQPELCITDRDIELVSIGGLCHDLGHGPFSHIFEGWIHSKSQVLTHFDRNVSKNNSNFIHTNEKSNIIPKHDFEHEDMSLKILKLIIDSYHVPISDIEYQLISCMISDKKQTDELLNDKSSVYTKIKGKQFMLDIVSNSKNSIDVDKFDYLLRDSKNSGKPCSIDPKRLMDNCRVIDDVLCYQQKEVWNVYDLFRTRYSMFRQVYCHKVTIAIELMLRDVFSLADPSFHFSSFVIDPKKYVLLNDNILDVIKLSHSNELDKAKDMIRRIEVRDIYRCVYDKIFAGERYDLVEEEIKQSILETDQAKSCELQPNDIRVHILKRNYAMGSTNPVTEVQFYNKKQLNKSFTINKEEVSALLPSIFIEFFVRVFCTVSKSNSKIAQKSLALQQAANLILSLEKKKFEKSQ